MHKLKKTVASNNFSASFIKIVLHFKRFYNIIVVGCMLGGQLGS